MEPVASGSTAPPPPFQDDPSEETDHLLHDFSNQHTSPGDDRPPPPDFSPYFAETITVGCNDIASHDRHLNTDGEALYRFLLYESSSPFYRLHCRGQHDERKDHWVTERDNNGRTRSRRESRTETVTDFEFYIDIYSDPNITPIQWTVWDTLPAYRGSMVREVTLPNGTTRKATRAELKTYKKWTKERSEYGIPPWVEDTGAIVRGESVVIDDGERLYSSKTVRQWADDYCTSTKYLKEFVYEKSLYGWNLHRLEVSIRAAISSTPYQGRVDVEFKPHGSKVYVRPDNRLSRMLSNKWIKFISILLLIYPFIWLFKRFHSRGGGRWEVSGAGYPLKRLIAVPADEGDGDLPPYDPKTPVMPVASNGPSPYVQTMNGRKKVIGTMEGQWFKMWEGTIKQAVIGRYQGMTPLQNPQQVQQQHQILLDGYGFDV
ncbi:hypothetical protein BDQ12DRAFT_600313 [Crucibulum laeve]|uniref:Uncharacterized protein n=1 Tax=Crucibulum laeve TaxID=68775 RepID=A0A5C3M9Q4_9AGAR|nr:hypothetical protein BDQ12DRAFT_600313 [Crucibulum laeve]